MNIKSLIQSYLSRAGYNLVDNKTLTELQHRSSHLTLVKHWIQPGVPRDMLEFVAANLPRAKGQLLQDLFVLNETKEKRNGFFVEFGSTNGVDFSNTYLLEKEFGWTGILAEPARCWHRSLRRNRKARIDTRCVWSRSGETVQFNETDTAGLSTIDSFSGSDMHARDRERGQKYSVKTVSLNDLLRENNAPQTIDYLSIDTEGSEFDILQAFNFSAYDVRIITCEHNYTPMREKIHALLAAKGYQRKYENVSQYDDWYVRV